MTATMILMNHEFTDEQLADVTEADFRNIDASAWARLLRHCKATELRLYHITTSSLEGIATLSSATDLCLEWATKVVSIEPVFAMNNLRRLSIFDFSKLRQIVGIERLENLGELNLSGSRGSLTPRLKLESIKPVTRLPSLTSFELANAELDDDDITPLAECVSLRRLSLANRFDRRQFAYLAKRLNAQLETPIVSHVDTRLPCPKCGGTKTMFTGRRMPFLCRVCDAKRFASLAAEFDRLFETA